MIFAWGGGIGGDLASGDELCRVGVHLLGRRLYETMLYWETADQNPSLDYPTFEFAAIWKALPKVAFSTTLSAVQENARVHTPDLERCAMVPGRYLTVIRTAPE
jgi:hypothetical protein